MSITPSSYKKIKAVKTWVTETLPTVSEDTYQAIVKDLLQYLDDIVTNDSFFSTDIKAIITELNKLLSQTHPSQSDIDSAVSAAKTELKTYADTKSTESLGKAKQYTDQLNNSTNKTITTLTASVNANTTGINAAKSEISKVASNVSKADARIDTVMSTHKQKIKDVITGAM